MAKRSSKKTVAVAALILIVVVAGAVAYYTVGRGEEQVTQAPLEPPTLGSGPITYTLNIAPGTILNYTSVFVLSQGEAQAEDTFNYTAKIIEVKWPTATVNYTLLGYNTSQPAPVAVTNLALPMSLVGKERIEIPVIVPGAQTGACVELSLVDEQAYTVNGKNVEALIYEFSYNASGIIVEGSIAYAKDTGLLLEFNSSVTDPANDVRGENYQVLTGYNIAGTISVSTPEDWLCKPPVSSELLYTIEGVYLARGLDFTPVSTLDIRKAMQDKALILIIAKDNQQLTNQFWKDFLRASIAFKDKAEFYVIVLGPLSTYEQRVFADYILGQAGAVEGNVLILIENGVAVGRVYSFGAYEDIVDLILQAYPDP